MSRTACPVLRDTLASDLAAWQPSSRGRLHPGTRATDPLKSPPLGAYLTELLIRPSENASVELVLGNQGVFTG